MKKRNSEIKLKDINPLVDVHTPLLDQELTQFAVDHGVDNIRTHPRMLSRWSQIDSLLAMLFRFCRRKENAHLSVSCPYPTEVLRDKNEVIIRSETLHTSPLAMHLHDSETGDSFVWVVQTCPTPEKLQDNIKFIETIDLS